MECAKPQIYFSWISSNVNPKLKISDQGNSLTSLSSIGPFKSAYGNYPLLPNGIYYWEIQIKKGSFFKIGIADHTKFKPDFTGAFSDTDFGYAFYSMGELRHQSNIKGPKYGQGYGIGDNVGVLFDRYLGTLSFFCNGLDLGVAFKGINLKNTVFYPAVACLLKDESISLKMPSRED